MSETKSGSPGEARPDRGSSPILEISYFTDPLCCWSWGFEPQLRRLRYGFAGWIAWRLRMGGMIGDWKTFSDPMNDISRPVQMGPLWIQAGTITGMPVDAMIWARNPPASSWPSCLAVKAAELQSPTAADLYLRRAREAVMADGRDIGSEDVLFDLAHDLAESRPDLFDAARFREDFAGPQARRALEDDVRETRFRHVGRFPCLRLGRPGREPAWLVGWRPYEDLIAAVRDFAPALGVERRPGDAESYSRYWGGATDHEIAVAVNPRSGPSSHEPADMFASGYVARGDPATCP